MEHSEYRAVARFTPMASTIGGEMRRTMWGATASGCLASFSSVATSYLGYRLQLARKRSSISTTIWSSTSAVSGLRSRDSYEYSNSSIGAEPASDGDPTCQRRVRRATRFREGRRGRARRYSRFVMVYFTGTLLAEALACRRSGCRRVQPTGSSTARAPRTHSPSPNRRGRSSLRRTCSSPWRRRSSSSATRPGSRERRARV